MWSQFSRKSMRLYQSHGNAPIVALTQSCRHLRYQWRMTHTLMTELACGFPCRTRTDHS